MNELQKLAREAAVFLVPLDFDKTQPAHRLTEELLMPYVHHCFRLRETVGRVGLQDERRFKAALVAECIGRFYELRF